jgi:Sec-independent protein translocase protein TatA
MSHGELALVVFILALVFGASAVPRLGEWVAIRLARRNDSSPRR